MRIHGTRNLWNAWKWMVLTVAGGWWVAGCLAPDGCVAYAAQPPPQTSTGPAKGTTCLPTEIRLSLASQKKLRWVVVKKQPFFNQIRASGRAVLPVDALHQISPQTSGTVVRYYGKPGQVVRRGQRLALLRSLNVGKARIRYRQTHAALQIAQSRWERVKKLAGMKLITRKEKLEARLALLEANNQWEMAQAMLQIMGVSRPSLKENAPSISPLFTMYSTRAGKITRLHAKIGQWVTPQTPLVSVADQSRMMVRMQIYVQDLPRVKPGQRVTLSCPSLHKSIESNIQRIADFVQPRTQSVEAWAVVKNTEGCLRAGQFLEAFVHTTVAGKTKQVVVPATSLQRLDQQHIAFVMGKQPGCYQVRAVVPGATAQGYTSIVYGLKPGERVITKGAFFLKSELLREQIEGE